MRARDRRILFATAVCAAGLPASAAAWVSVRTAALADQLTAAGGVPARIGAVDADLTATLRLSDVALGDLVRADAIDASVALDSLLSGTLRADEIRILAPRVALQVDPDGDSDLARLARRLLGPGGPGAPGAPGGPGSPGASNPGASAGPAGHAGSTGRSRLRRIAVTSGTLTARIAGVGEIEADGVELVPDGARVRLITRALRLDGRAGPLDVRLAFTRSAAELTLPHLQIDRVLAVGGAGTVTPVAQPGQARPAAPGGPDLTVRLRDVAAGRLTPGGALALRASVDDAGIARPLAIDFLPRDLAISLRGDRIPLGALAPVLPAGIDLAVAHATGTLAVRRDAAHTSVDVDGTLDGISLDHRALAATPVRLAVGIRAAVAISPEAVAVSRATLDLGAAHWAASGWLRRGTPSSGQLDLSLATAPCNDLLAALPVALRGPLDGLALDGSFGGRVRLTVDLAAPPGEGVELTTSIADDCRAQAEPPAADVTRLAEPRPSRPGQPTPAALRQLPHHVAAAFVSAEDARFYDHAGFDLEQIARSLEIDLREHRLVRGGSTISQQLVKNAFLSQRRSIDRKLQEAILTWRLESRLTKPQILERYLNLIELGPGVFGLAAAARHWFALSPRELSVRQAAFLAALTSEPTSMSRRVSRTGGLDLESAARVDVILRAMHRDGALDATQLEAAGTTPLRFTATALQQDR